MVDDKCYNNYYEVNSFKVINLSGKEKKKSGRCKSLCYEKLAMDEPALMILKENNISYWPTRRGKDRLFLK